MSSYVLLYNLEGDETEKMDRLFGSRAVPILSYKANTHTEKPGWYVWEVPMETPEVRRALRSHWKKGKIFFPYAFSKSSLPMFLAQRVLRAGGMNRKNGRQCFFTTIQIMEGYEKVVLKALHAALRERQRMDYEELCAMACYVTSTQKLRIPTPSYRKGLIYHLQFLTPVDVPKRRGKGFFKLEHITVPAHGKDIIPSGPDVVWTPQDSLRNPPSLSDYMLKVTEYFRQRPHPPRNRMYVVRWHLCGRTGARAYNAGYRWRYRKPKSGTKKGWKFMLTPRPRWV